VEQNMSLLETGVTGAKTVPWVAAANPRELLLALVQSLPDADEATLARHMRDRVLDDSRDRGDAGGTPHQSNEHASASTT
jgi:hypothetical protein